jgi:hydroxyquinol 1,2-dioxygenase
VIGAPGYHGCVTHLFRKGDAFIETDVVYGVKEPLIVDFVERPPGKAPTGEVLTTPFYEVKYDFVLQPADDVRRRAGRSPGPVSQIESAWGV